jgi:RNA methyltransferase, TrmH family
MIDASSTLVPVIIMVTFQIKSLQHSIVKHCVNLRKNPNYRKQSDSFLITGKKQILEIPSHLKVLNIFTLEDISPIHNAENHYIVSPEILYKISGTISPEPYVAEVKIPHLKLSQLNRLLICDGVSDPGNLGTLLRTALSFGFDGAYLINQCVDPFNEKVIRASKGALFHLPVMQGNWDELLALQKQSAMHLYQADTQGTSLSLCSISPPFGLILGNEAHGTSKEAKMHAQGITIPMSHHTESLNVAIAGGILMFNTSSLCQK